MASNAKEALRLFCKEDSPNPFRLLARNLQSNPDAPTTSAPPKPPTTHDTRYTSHNRPSVHIAFFPWDTQSIKRLWHGELENQPVLKAQWLRVSRDYSGVFAVARERKVRLLRSSDSCALESLYTIALDKPPADIVHNTPTATSKGKRKVPKRKAKNPHDDDILALAWALDPNEPSPLLLVAASRVLHIFDVARQCARGALKGHGADITALAVHPIYPQYVCSTSRDYTTRFYDLTRDSRYMIPDPQRPVRGSDHYGGPPFGMQVRTAEVDGVGELPPGIEGFGFGKCVGVLWGFIAGVEVVNKEEVQRMRGGGHHMAVLNVDFHPTRDLMVTCGLDHNIKIWRVPPLPFKDPVHPSFHRDQLPVFTSSAIHAARVVSVRWIDYDILLSESVPTQTGQEQEERHTFVIWQWLAIDRFSEKEEDGTYTESNYAEVTESYSYRILSVHDVQMPKHSRAHLHGSLGRWLLFCPTQGGVHVYNLALFKPCEPPPFPADLVEARAWNDDRLVEEQRKREQHRYVPRPQPHAPWVLDVVGDEPLAEGAADMHIGACAMAPGRKRVVAVSMSGDVFVWKREQEKK